MAENYSQDTKGAQFAIDKSWPLMDQALSHLPARSSYEILNYGAADGGTSMDYFRRIFEELKGKRIYFTSNDLPQNNFNGLAPNLEILRSEFEGLCVFIQPTSFYNLIAREDSVDIGFAATTMHWLSQVPRRAIGHLHPNRVEGDIREQFRAQALTDFDRLLKLRACEFRRGGHFILVDLAQTPDGEFLGHNGTDPDLFDTLHDIWKALLNEKLISKETFEYTLIENYYKTADEVQRILDLPHSKKNWKVHSLSTKTISGPSRTQFAQDGDISIYASKVMKAVRSWCRHSFMSAVQQTGGDPSTVELLFSRLQQRIAETPEQYNVSGVHNFIHLERL
ncbi:class I SAM-dependent methyltransferase [Flexibacterium corallicola]|uniref:hypothetical protein n=1 Tax=Flexibacterium corallicola TaxID=3037259 RepID=UPI00286EC43B|nr:hypothetical protein [Pseudovibrio sp. M1P-2-3]